MDPWLIGSLLVPKLLEFACEFRAMVLYLWYNEQETYYNYNDTVTENS